MLHVLSSLEHRRSSQLAEQSVKKRFRQDLPGGHIAADDEHEFRAVVGRRATPIAKSWTTAHVE
jgi:hypothetical protein